MPMMARDSHYGNFDLAQLVFVFSLAYAAGRFVAGARAIVSAGGSPEYSVRSSPPSARPPWRHSPTTRWRSWRYKSATDWARAAAGPRALRFSELGSSGGNAAP
jgi:hypothetical protein